MIKEDFEEKFLGLDDTRSEHSFRAPSVKSINEPAKVQVEEIICEPDIQVTQELMTMASNSQVGDVYFCLLSVYFTCFPAKFEKLFLVATFTGVILSYNLKPSKKFWNIVASLTTGGISTKIRDIYPL